MFCMCSVGAANILRYSMRSTAEEIPGAYDGVFDFKLALARALNSYLDTVAAKFS